MNPPEASRDIIHSHIPRITQACDADCAYFETMAAFQEWGWCHDPACPFHQGLVRPGRERSCFAPRPGGLGR